MSDLEPITQGEFYMAAAAGEYDGELPDPVIKPQEYWVKIIERIDKSCITPEEIDAAIEAYLNSHDADIVTEQELFETLAGYYTKSDIDTSLDGKADANHTHSGMYAPASHNHAQSDITGLDDALSGKAPVSHSHAQSDVIGLEDALSGKAAAVHHHDDRYYTETEMDTALAGKAAASHEHDDRYYTETEMDSKLGEKSNAGHTHDDRYYTEAETDTLLSGKANAADIPDVSAFITRLVNDLVNYYKKSETYSKAEIDGLVSAIPKFAIKVVNELPSQNISETTVYLLTSQTQESGNLYTEYLYVGNKWELLGSQTVDLSDYYTKSQVDTLLSGLSVSGHTHDDRCYTEAEIDGKMQTINTALSGKAASNHTHDDRYYTEAEMDSKLGEKSNAGHSHVVADVTGLDSALAGKAAASHSHAQADVTGLADALAGKAPASHTHNYAGSSSAGGSATSAVKLDTSTAGSATQPCYFANGKPSACTYSLNKTVPIDAEFTDTVYAHPAYTARTGKPTGNQTPAFGGTVTVSQVTSDALGHVTGMTDRTIKMPDAVATQSAAGLMSKEDKAKLDNINIVLISQSDYDALSSPDSSTLYLIPEASS